MYLCRSFFHSRLLNVEQDVVHVLPVQETQQTDVVQEPQQTKDMTDYNMGQCVTLSRHQTHPQTLRKMANKVQDILNA